MTPQPTRSAPAMAGVVLCGGRSDRMGTDKAWLPWGRRTLLEHMVLILRTFCKPVAAVHAPGQRLPNLPADIITVEDSISNQGPLCGLQSGLSQLAEFQDFVFVTPCDTPMITSAMAIILLDRLGGHDAAVFRDEHGWIPLPGLYRTRVSVIARQRLAVQQRSLQGLLDEIDTVGIEMTELLSHGLSPSSLLNLNTPAEYKQALVNIEPDTTSLL